MHLKRIIKDGLARLLATLMTRRISNFLSFDGYFQLWERKGLHITPVHFYQPLPDLRELASFDWDRVSQLPGLDLNESGQLRLLSDLSGSYIEEYSAFSKTQKDSGSFYINNGTFEAVDCELYYSLVRHFRPATILEVGGGNSTLIAAKAALANQAETGVAPKLTVIEPFPNQVLTSGFQGLSGLICDKLESVPLEVFLSLGSGDILFIDSSHVVKTGNDVHRLYLEILPRLNQGVMVHIHDIFFPLDYPQEVIIGRKRFWNEQYLVQAFLSFNHSFEVMWCSAFMHHYNPEKLEAAFPSYSRTTRRPGSLWLRKTS